MGLVSKRKHCGSGRSPRWLTEQNPRAGSEAPSGRRLGILLYAEKQLTKDDRVGKGGGKDRGMAIKPRKKPPRNGVTSCILLSILSNRSLSKLRSPWRQTRYALLMSGWKSTDALPPIALDQEQPLLKSKSANNPWRFARCVGRIAPEARGYWHGDYRQTNRVPTKLRGALGLRRV
jgi:hypothetical protein